MTYRLVIAIAGLWLGVGMAAAQTQVPASEPVGRKLIEIYRLAPGQHEAFLRAIAQYDEANRRAGVPPRQLYVHSDGASWDFLLIQDAAYPEGKGDLVDKAFKDMGLPSGPRFFTEFRKFVTEHTDTFASGPTTAAAYLAELDATPRVAADGGPGSDAGRYELRTTLPLGGTPRWDYLKVDADARRLYVAHDTCLDVVDLDRQTLIGRVAGLAGAHGIALAPATGRGFVANSDRNSVSVFSLKTLAVIGEAPVGREPDSVTFEPVTGRLFVWNGASRDVSILDAATLRAVKTLPLGGTPEFAVADGRGAVFANIEETHEIVRIDAAGPTLAARLPVAGCEEPGALAYDPGAHRLFSACSNGVLASLDAQTGRVLGTARIARGVDALVFDRARSQVFASSAEGVVSMVGVAPDGSVRPVSELRTQATGRTMALDPITGAIYVPAVDMDVDWSGRTASFAKDGLKLYVFERRDR